MGWVGNWRPWEPQISSGEPEGGKSLPYQTRAFPYTRKYPPSRNTRRATLISSRQIILATNTTRFIYQGGSTYVFGAYLYTTPACLYHSLSDMHSADLRLLVPVATPFERQQRKYANTYDAAVPREPAKKFPRGQLVSCHPTGKEPRPGTI